MHIVFGIAYSEDTLVNIVYDARDGNAYKTVKIGNQIWLAENMRYLPNVTPTSYSSFDENCYYVANYYGTDLTEAITTDEYKKTGVLYNWQAAMNGEPSSTSSPSGITGICPQGWHIPSKAE